MHNLKRNFIWMLSGKTLAMAAGFVSGALINRALGPSMRGVYAEMQTWIGLFAVIFGISIDTAIYHFANKSLYGNDDQARFITIASLSLIYALTASVALTVFTIFFPGQVSSGTSRYIFILDVVLITTMLVGNLTVFLQALGNIRYPAIIGCIQGLSTVIIIGIAYWADLINIELILLCIIIVQVVTFFMLFLRFKKDNLLRGKFSKPIAKGIIVSGLKQHIATMATFIYTKINQLIVFKYCGESETGLFSVSLSAAFYLMFIPMTFQTVLYPRVINGTDDYEITIKSLRLTFYGWGLIVLSMIIFAKPIIVLYAGKTFLPSVTTFRILLIATWFLPLSSLVAPYCIKLGAFYTMSFSAILLGILSMAFNWLLIPNLMKIGAAIVTSLTCMIGFSFALLLLWFLSCRNPIEFLKLKRMA